MDRTRGISTVSRILDFKTTKSEFPDGCNVLAKGRSGMICCGKVNKQAAREGEKLGVTVFLPHAYDSAYTPAELSKEVLFHRGFAPKMIVKFNKHITGYLTSHLPEFKKENIGPMSGEILEVYAGEAGDMARVKDSRHGQIFLVFLDNLVKPDLPV